MKKLLILVSIISFCIAGTYSGGAGTSNNPYHIDNLGDLNEMSSTTADWDKYFIQTSNIDASATSTWHSGAGWSPIGNRNTKFTGNYKGNGKIITGMYVNRPSDEAQAFFGWTENATISGLRLFDCTIIADRMSGGMVGVLYSSSVSNCGTTGNVTCNQSAGGFAGSVKESTINNCYSEANVTAPTNDGHYRFGGFAGSSSTYSTITNCYARGNVTGYRWVGGFIGMQGEWAAVVVNENSTIEDCYSTGLVNATLSGGGFAGHNESDCVLHFCYWDYETSNDSYSPFGYEKSTSQMKTQSTFYGWDFTDTWTFDAIYNDGYPVLKWLTVDPERQSVEPSGTGTAEDPFQIGSLDNLYWISEDISRWAYHYIQTADIDASSTSSWYMGRGWSPIGNYNTKFTGSYNGQGYNISGLTINRTNDDDDYIGLFGYIANSTSIININLDDASIEGDGYVAGIAGYIYGSLIKNCSFSGNVVGRVYAGGIAGEVRMGTIVENCYSEGTVIANHSYAGGLIAHVSYEAEVSNCYSKSSVETDTYAGGFAGKTYNCRVEDCYSTGLVSGNTYKGGFIGSALNVSYTYPIKDCFWDINTSGTSTSAQGTGKTTAEMKTLETFTVKGWDFTTIWGLIAGLNEEYPYLKSHITLSAPSVTTDSVLVTGENTATVYYSITDTGVPAGDEHGLCWNTTGNPSILDSVQNEGPIVIQGNYSADVSSLAPDTYYYIRAYAANTVDTTYGDVLIFRTPENPSIINLYSDYVDTSSINVRYHIDDLGYPGITESGFAIKEYWKSDAYYAKTFLGGQSSTGSTGYYYTGLTPNTSYDIFAFAANPYDTVYTDTIQVRTYSLPRVDIEDAYAATDSSFLVEGEVYFKGYPIAEHHGFCWNTSDDPTIEDQIIDYGGADSAEYLYETISDLDPNTTYYIRLFATNTVGTAYSESISINTKGKPGLTDMAVNNILTDSATVSAELLELGDPSASEHGFALKDLQSAEDFAKIFLGKPDSAGVFSTELGGLTANTAYEIFAFAATYYDTICSDTIAFTTLGTPTVVTDSITVLGIDMVEAFGSLISMGNPAVSQHGFCWSTDTLPTIEDRKIELGSIDSIGVFSSLIDSLSENVRHYIRAYAINEIDVVYGDTISFRTEGRVAVDSLFVSEIDSSSARLTAEITNLGYPYAIVHGFAWKHSDSPDSSYRLELFGAPDSIGSFSTKLNGLLPNSEYNAFAFLANMNDTAYTDTVSFETHGLPSLAITSITEIDTGSATVYGRFSELGNPLPRQYGFCWSTDIHPTIEDEKIELGIRDSLGDFSAILNELEMNTVYYVRAFAINDLGTVYSDTISFRTLVVSLEDMIPNEFSLSQNYPNPFNPTTTLTYGLPESADIKLVIYNLMGRKIKQWEISGQGAGWHKLIWDGTDMGGKMVSTGVYIYSMKAGDFIDTRKMVFMK